MDTKNSNKFTIMHRDALTNVNSESFNFALTVEQCYDTDTATALDNFARGYCNLTTDTYYDCKIKTVVNLDSLAGGNS